MVNLHGKEGLQIAYPLVQEDNGDLYYRKKRIATIFEDKIVVYKPGKPTQLQREIAGLVIEWSGLRYEVKEEEPLRKTSVEVTEEVYLECRKKFGSLRKALEYAATTSMGNR